MEKPDKSTWYASEKDFLKGQDAVQFARILPLKLKQNEPFAIELSGFSRFADERATITIEIVDVALSFFREVESNIDRDGKLTLQVNKGFDTSRPCSVYVGSVKVAGRTFKLKENPASLLNIEFDDRIPQLAQQIHRSIFEQHKSLYLQSIGKPQPEALQYRAFCLVEGVDIAEEVSLGPARVIPVQSRTPDLERRGIFNDLLASFKVSTRVPESEWKLNAERQSSMVLVVFPKVLAADFDSAHRLAGESLVAILGTLAVHRLVPPRTVAIVLEQRREDGTTASLIFPPSGTWVGTPTPTVEPIRDLQAIHDVVAADRFLQLCVEQFRIAMQQRDLDVKFLHFFSVLELLGGQSHPRASKKLIDGSPWPYPSKPNDPAPKIYDALVEMLNTMKRPESSTAFPATNLYQAVQGWKGRRNATTHYGGFDPTDAAQKQQPWFAAAERTLTNEFGWERGLVLATSRLLRFRIEQARSATS